MSNKLRNFFLLFCLVLLFLVPVSLINVQSVSAHSLVSTREANAVTWVRSQIGAGDNYSWRGLCLPFAQAAFGVHSGADNPKALAPQLSLAKTMMPPAGWLIIFGDNYVWHIAVSTGSGFMVHASFSRPVEEISISRWIEISGEWLVGSSPAPPNWLGRAA